MLLVILTSFLIILFAYYVHNYFSTSMCEKNCNRSSSLPSNRGSMGNFSSGFHSLICRSRSARTSASSANSCKSVTLNNSNKKSEFDSLTGLFDNFNLKNSGDVQQSISSLPGCNFSFCLIFVFRFTWKLQRCLQGCMVFRRSNG